MAAKSAFWRVYLVVFLCLAGAIRLAQDGARRLVSAQPLRDASPGPMENSALPNGVARIRGVAATYIHQNGRAYPLRGIEVALWEDVPLGPDVQLGGALHTVEATSAAHCGLDREANYIQDGAWHHSDDSGYFDFGNVEVGAGKNVYFKLRYVFYDGGDGVSLVGSTRLTVMERTHMGDALAETESQRLLVLPGTDTLTLVTAPSLGTPDTSADEAAHIYDDLSRTYAYLRDCAAFTPDPVVALIDLGSTGEPSFWGSTIDYPAWDNDYLAFEPTSEIIYQYAHALLYFMRGGSLPPLDDGDGPHGGCSNLASADGLAEGWARFLPARILDDPHFYWGAGAEPRDLSRDDGEFAACDRSEWTFGAILWDLWSEREGSTDSGFSHIVQTLANHDPDLVATYYNQYLSDWGDCYSAWLVFHQHNVDYAQCASPAAPDSLLAAPISQTQIDLTWQDHAVTESGFILERSLAGQGDWVGVVTLAAGATGYSDVDRDCGTGYDYRIRAYRSGDGQFSEYSNLASAATHACQPANFAKNGPANGAVDLPANLSLSWQPSTGAVSYEYCYDAFNDGICNTTWHSTGDTSAALSGLSSGATVYWQVRAVNPVGAALADGGSWWRFTVQSSPPDGFTKVGPVDGATGVTTNPALSWNGSSAADSYEYCLDTLDNEACDAGWINVGASTNVLLSGLSGVTDYYWQVRARNVHGLTLADGGVWWRFSTQAALPGAFAKSGPEHLSANQPTSLNLYWQPSSGATSYEYCYDLTNDSMCAGSWIVTDNTSASLNGLLSGSTYYWQVRARNALGATDANAGVWWQFSIGPTASDKYESDNTSAQASLISPGSSQTHSIVPANDVDWAMFNLAANSQVILVTSGPAGYNTRLWLYDGSLNQVEYNDDGGVGNYSFIDRLCGSQSLAPGTYYVKVDEWGNNNQVPSYQLSLAVSSCEPGVFGKLAPSDQAGGTATALTLSWQASVGAASYTYCYDTTPGATCETIWHDNGSYTSVDLSGLAPNAAYFWQVYASNDSGDLEADGGAWWRFTTGDAYEPNNASGQAAWLVPGSPQAHSILPASDVDWAMFSLDENSQVTIETSGSAGYDTRLWLYASGPGGLSEIEWDDDSGEGNYARIDRLCAVDALPPGTYYIKVDEKGNDHVVPEYQLGLAVSSCLPAAFNKLLPSDLSSNISTSLALSWQGSVGASSYRYCIDTTRNDLCDGGWISAGGSTSALVSGLSYGVTYYWQVQAENGSGFRDADGRVWWRFITQVSPPDPFEKIGPVDGASNLALSPTLHWGSSRAASSYEVCWDTDDNDLCDSDWHSSASSTSIGLSGLDYATTYFWQVSARNSTGLVEADGGAWRHFTTRLAPPEGFSKIGPLNATGNLCGPLPLVWQASSGAASYEYCYDTTNNAVCNGLWRPNGANTSATLIDLADNTTYFWQVRSRNASSSVSADGGSWWQFTSGASCGSTLYLPFVVRPGGS
ncbi:MAG: pre-peptidase C-terminal domain-containing protein [Chloroflexota bacterium]